MEVDAPAPRQKHVKIHPLSIITISDHHTRITSGGSALPPTSPAIGLLFGTRTDSATTIVDAEELDPSTTSHEGGNQLHQLVQTKIELHRKVFPLHAVIGWYRVGEDDEPTPQDLRRNQLEISQYCTGGGDASSPVFLLVNPPREERRYDLVEDDQLPLTVYETLQDGENGGAVFVNVKFELETFEPERIALEKVFRSAPVVSSCVAPKDGGEKKSDERKVKKSKKEEVRPEVPPPPSALDGSLEALQSSIRALNARMRVLLEFLCRVERGEVPKDEVLLRSVEGLLQKLPLVYAALEEGIDSSILDGRAPLRELENEYNDTMLLSYLATVAKTAKTVYVYTEKYRSACESRRSM